MWELDFSVKHEREDKGEGKKKIEGGRIKEQNIRLLTDFTQITSVTLL